MTRAAPAILVFGSNGQLGRSLAALGASRIQTIGRDQIDLEQSTGEIDGIIQRSNASAVVNAAAWTAVDLAEAEPNRAFLVNAEAPAAMAAACKRLGLPFVHVSTDYVFDGSGRKAWSEDDPTGPLNVYGQTKLAGEKAVMAAHNEALIVRTSWVVSEYGKNFVRTMLGLADRPELRIVGDQFGVPTDARELARFILNALDRHELGTGPDRSGILHFRNSGEPVSWADFATDIFEAAGGPAPTIVPISTQEFGAPAPRPQNSVLSLDRLARVWAWRPATWREGVRRIVSALQANAD